MSESSVPSSNQFGFIEGLDGAAIVGWAIDRAKPGRAARLAAFVDGELVAQADAGLERDDVADRFPDHRHAGFRVAIPDRFLDGFAHRVSVRFADSGAYVLSPMAGGPHQPVFEATFPSRLRLISHIDGLSGGGLRGWVLVDRAGVRTGGQSILVRCGGQDVATIKADLCRVDVGRAMQGDEHCGFQFRPPVRFRDGAMHTFEFFLAGTEQQLDESPHSFAYPEALPEARLARLFTAVDTLSMQLFRLKRELMEVMEQDGTTLQQYDRWARQYQAALRQRRRAAVWPADVPRPLVSVLCPVYRPKPEDFKAAVESVLGQTWREFELILVDDASRDPALTRTMRAFAKQDSRVRLVTLKENRGISGATNAAIEAARGEFVAFFDHDDLLLDVALETMMDAARLTGAQMLYSDEDKIDGFGRFSDPNLKPAWNGRLLLAQNYVCHLLVVRTEAARRAGPLDRVYDGAQDHDLVLRLAEILPAEAIAHVPEIVYHWRKTPGSTASGISAKSYAVMAGAQAVQAHLTRRGLKARVSPMLDATVYRTDFQFRATPPVLVVIPFKDQAEITGRCLDALLGLTAYRRLSVVLVDNWSTTPDAAALCARATRDARVTVRRVEEPFNYSRLNNLACDGADATFLVFMNNDVIVSDPSWLRTMVNEALADPGVAAVGAKLVYPGGRVQHAGTILGVDGVGDHAFRHCGPADPCYMGRAICTQEMSAVTAALMLCRTSAFREVGGFDEEALAVAYNDVDLCLKLRAAGHRIVQCQTVLADHHESLSRGDDLSGDRLSRFVFEQNAILSRWGGALRADPFYNPNFSAAGGIFTNLSRSALRADAIPVQRARVGGAALRPVAAPISPDA